MKNRKIIILFLTAVLTLGITSFTLQRITEISTKNLNLQTKSGAIRQVLAGIDAAWNKGDAISFASYWTEDGTVSNPMGEITEGRAEIEKTMISQFTGSVKGTIHKLTVTKFYWPKPDVGVVDGEAEVTIVASKGGAMPSWKANFTAIFVKDRRGKWSVSHLRSYTYVQPSPGTGE